MSEEENPELGRSWVFLEPGKTPLEDKATSGVEEVVEDNEPHRESDSDSISVISESGCSYKSDEDELLVPEEAPVEKEEKKDTPEKEAPMEEAPVAILNVVKQEVDNARTNRNVPIGAICAIFFLGFSVAIQQYFSNNSDVNTFDNDIDYDLSKIPHHVRNTKPKDEGKSFTQLKRKFDSRLEESRNKLIKLQDTDADIHDKIARPDIRVGNNDLAVEGEGESNFKHNKNMKPAEKFNKENYDTSKKSSSYTKKKFKNYDDKKYKNEKKWKKQYEDGADYDKKLEELKMKEDYLKGKEKFLLEKEHDLLRKERKLEKEKKYEQKDKKDKDFKYVKKDKSHNKQQKKYTVDERDEPNNSHKKYKNKEDKKKNYLTDKNVDEINKKRNLSGQWYINMHKARDDIRHKERASDWVFDRAYFRNTKRNKAHWYFQWMLERARHRVK